MDAPAIEVSPPEPRDIPRIHGAYDELGEDGHALFHPGFLGREPWTLRGVAGRWLLRASARPSLQRLLVALPRVPYLIAVVARSGGDLAGFGFVLVRKTGSGPRGSFGIFVRTAFEGRGVGRRLTLAALDAAAGHGLVRVELTVQVRNTRARRLYEGCGFVVEETLPQGDAYAGRSYDALRMAVRVPDPEVTR